MIFLNSWENFWSLLFYHEKCSSIWINLHQLALQTLLKKERVCNTHFLAVRKGARTTAAYVDLISHLLSHLFWARRDMIGVFRIIFCYTFSNFYAVFLLYGRVWTSVQLCIHQLFLFNFLITGILLASCFLNLLSCSPRYYMFFNFFSSFFSCL